MKTFLFLLSFCLTAQAQFHGDIDHHVEEVKEGVFADFFRADEIERSVIRNEGFSMTTYIRKNGQLRLLDPFTVTVRSKSESVELLTNGETVNPNICSKGEKAIFRGNLVFENKYYTIEKRKPYEFLFDLKCGESTKFIFDYDSHAGEVMAIFEIAEKAKIKFEKLGLLDFWNRDITIKWPGSGDYYSWGTVNVTKGFQWDVVGHEIGHAIYDYADIGRFGGGAHRIDECYTDSLALSEGWASFFAAWLKVQLTDADAKFEYMVPRRAPLRFENIPTDVCKGPRNEWRVTGFLWDIIDHNEDDQDTSRMSFKDLWLKTKGKNFRGIEALADFLETDGFDPVLLNIVWEQNFLQSR
jgi:hypothetical protein